jgi:predicted lipoprotein with Yx(FWY)xxD motif
MQYRWLAAAGLAATVASVAACGSSSPGGSVGQGGGGSATPASTGSPTASHAAAGAALKAGKAGGAKVLTNAKGFTVYWFAPDTATTSKCTGTCAHYWPPVPGPAARGPGVTGTLGTITRPGGSVQATYNGHPLYTYVADTAAGQAKGNGVKLSGGVWHEITLAGKAKPSSGGSSSSGSGGYGY